MRVHDECIGSDVFGAVGWLVGWLDGWLDLDVPGPRKLGSMVIGSVG